MKLVLYLRTQVVDIMHSTSEENYLKAIYKLNNRGLDIVPNGALAESMGVQAASVSDMLKRLADKNLIIYQKNKGCSLTESGRMTALKTLRKHRLWEVFLLEKLEFGWDEVHDLAEQLEHIQSDELTDRLSRFLGDPTIDPHGDPIPDKEGQMPQILSVPLLSAEPHKVYVINRFIDSSSDFLQYIDKLDLTLGTELTILGQEKFDGSLHIQLDNNRHLHISHLVAGSIVVRPAAI